MAHDNWYTPTHIIEPVRQFYGGTIDLDPASCLEANSIIQAKKCFNEATNGLQMNWSGNVWCNPPYCGRSTVQDWITKATDEYNSGNCNQIVMLLNRSDSMAYYRFIDLHQGGYYEGGYYQLRKRVKFINGLPDDKPSSPRYNNDLIYFGNKGWQFQLMCKRAFGEPVPSSF